MILEVLNPRAELDAAPVQGLAAPRLDTLNGKKIALLGVKPDSFVFFTELKRLLNARFPEAIIEVRPLSDVKEACPFDAWVTGVKTSGDGKLDQGARLEKMGIPGVDVVADDLLPQRRRVAETNGLPAIRLVTVPARKYFVCECKAERLRPVAEAALDDIIAALTAPLTDAEMNPKPPDYDFSPLTFAGADYSEALEKFQTYFAENNLGDGLPLIPPTKEAVANMLKATSSSPQELLGTMVPRYGKATIEKVAINAVMAGALPQYLPVIIAAVKGMVDKRFNLYHISTGTLNSSALVIVNGPIAKEIGMNARDAFLSPGNRANSTIGRAISLCMMNIGWSFFKTEGGTVGNPTRYTNLIFAENEAESPWESFSVQHGFSPEDSTVTVDECIWYDKLGPSGCMRPAPLESDMKKLAGMVKSFTGGMCPARGKEAGGGIMMMSDYESAVNANYCTLVLYPALAHRIAEAGYTKRQFIQWLCDRHRYSWEDYSDAQQLSILEAAKKGSIPGLTVDDCRSGGTIPNWNPNHLAVLVAGSMAGMAMAFYGGAATQPNFDNLGSTEIDYMTQKVTGATLTAAGR